MIQTAVGVIGYTQLGKRVADALTVQPDLRLAGVAEVDPQRCKVLQQLCVPRLTGESTAWADQCAVIVACGADVPALNAPTVYAPDAPAGPPLFGAAPLDNVRACRAPCSDAIAFARLLAVLPAVESIVANSVRPGVALDALEPRFEQTDEDVDIWTRNFAVQSILIRRTRAPYTGSHLHHVKFELTKELSRDDALAALGGASRVRIGRGRDGLQNTGLLQEFDRDAGRRRGDRPEVFIWEESVETRGRRLYLTMDVCPLATPIPEIVDAVRLLARPEMTPWQASVITSQSLGLRG